MEKTIILNGENYTIGDKVLSIGLDMRCFDVVCIGRILEWNEEENYYIEESDGCKTKTEIIYTTWDGKTIDSHNEFWCFSKKNLETLKQSIKNK